MFYIYVSYNLTTRRSNITQIRSKYVTNAINYSLSKCLISSDKYLRIFTYMGTPDFKLSRRLFQLYRA